MLSKSLAWNAAFKDNELYLIRPESVKHFSILGTPWEKGLKYAQKKQVLLDKEEGVVYVNGRA